MLKENALASARFAAAAVMSPALPPEVIKAPRITYEFECFGPDEQDRAELLRLLKRVEAAEMAHRFDAAASLRAEAQLLVKPQWRDVIHNLVTTVGKTDIVDKYVKASAYTAASTLR